MSVEQQVDALTASVNNLKAAVVSKKATLDASVADAQSATAQAQAAKVNALSTRDQAGAFKDAAYSAAQSAASAVAYQDLSAVDLTKAVAAVDVFLYDTSKDSDGGAWRHRCAGTSWYREPLNTATRGARREFPAVALIVAEANKVTIYDGDDPALPIWMVFNGAVSHSIFLGFSSPGGLSVTMRDGNFCVGTTGISTNGSINGLAVANFVADTLSKYDEVGFAKSSQGIADRNDNAWSSGLGWWSIAKDATKKIVNQYVNDVALTVLPDAPMDPSSGLPLPTIAVATAGGVSVIKDDGRVFDGDVGKSILDVGFDAHALFWQTSTIGYWAKYVPVEMITTDNFDPYAASIFATSQGNTGYPKIPASGSINHLASGGENTLVAGDEYFGLSQLLLGKAYVTTTDRPDRMLSCATSRYATGWMPGANPGQATARCRPGSPAACARAARCFRPAT